MILPVIFLSKPDAFCNLPLLLASRYKNVSFAVLQFLWNGSNCDSHSQYVGWIGGIASGDAVELPASQFQSVAHDSVRVEEVLTHLEKADEVYFTPLTGYDWDVISTQAAIVESKLLTQLSIAYKGQIIRIQISSSLSASLKCTGVKTGSRRSADEEILRRREARSTAETSPERKKFDQYDTDVIPDSVAKLGSDTLAIIAPFVPSDDQKLGYRELSCSKNEINSPSFGGYITDIVSLMSGIEEGSKQHTLRVLPQSVRSSDTSYRSTSCDNRRSGISNVKDRVVSGKSNSTSSSSNSVSCLEDLMNELLLGNAWEETDNIPLKQEEKVDGREINGDAISSADEYSCLVHPSFLQTAYESSVQKHSLEHSNERSSLGNLSLHNKKQLFDKYLLPYYIGVLYSNSSHDDSSERSSTNIAKNNIFKAITNSIIVSVRISYSIRPYHISVPKSIRKGMNVSDYSHVRLIIKGTTGSLGNSLKGPIMPYMMSLQPITWKKIPHGAENILSSTDMKIDDFDINKISDNYDFKNKDENDSRINMDNRKVGSKYNERNLNIVRESFVAYFMKYDHEKNIENCVNDNKNEDSRVLVPPLILSDGSVITLSHRLLDNHNNDNYNSNDDNSSHKNNNNLNMKVNMNMNNDDKNDCSPLKKILINDEDTKMISVDYMIKIYKNESSISDINDKSKSENTILNKVDSLKNENNHVSSLNNTQTNNDNNNDNIENIDKFINNEEFKEFKGEYCLLDNIDMIMDCVDIMELKTDRIVSLLNIDHDFEIDSPTSSLQHLLNQRGWIDRSPLSPKSPFLHRMPQNIISPSPLFDQNRPNILLKSLLKTNATASAVVTDVLSALLPIAINDALHSQCPTPPLGSIITGPKSSGKTTLCSSIIEFLRINKKTMTHTQYFDCKSFRGKKTKEIIDILSQLFLKAKKFAPSFLCFDNLDFICPSSPEDSSAIMSATQYHLVTMQMKYFLSDLSEKVTKKYKNASKSVKIESVLENKLDKSDFNTEKHHQIEAFDLAVSHILSGSVYVLATGDFYLFSNIITYYFSFFYYLFE